MATPNSYKDPYWTQLALSTEKELGLPDTLLARIVTRGERTNNDQVSDAGAKTVFQIIPATRKAGLEKYGIDAYLSDKNAAKVAGLILKDSLKRNNNDEMLATAEYVGGLDRKNWGPVTKSYIQRVFDKPLSNNDTGEYQSIFANEKLNKKESAGIKGIYEAYKSGKMDEQQMREFEEDVNAGAIMLPRGASLKVDTKESKSSGPIILPQSVTDAYVSNKMNEEQRSELESDIRAGIVKLPPSRASLIPGESPDWIAPTEQGIITRPNEPSLGDKLIGAGEAALTTATGITNGIPALVGGAAIGIADAVSSGNFGTQQGIKKIENRMLQGMEALTYAPKTETGQEYAQNVGKVLQETVPLAGLSGEMAALNAATRTAAPAIFSNVRSAAVPLQTGALKAKDIVQSGAMNLVDSVKNAPNRAAEMVGLREPTSPPAMAGVGAAQTPGQVLRTEKSQGLPVPVTLTKGASSREAQQLAFEKEQMKGPLGEPLRERAEKNNLEILQNFDALIDDSGKKSVDIASTGNSVVKALSKGWKEAKAQTRAAYTKAKKSDESLAEVDPATQVPAMLEGEQVNTSLIDYLNSVPNRLNTTGLPDHVKAYAVELGIAARGENGKLIPLKSNVKKMEELRTQVNQAKGIEPIDDFYSSIIKDIIDKQTEPVAGPLYQKARALRTEQAHKFENRAVIARLLTNKGRSEDPKVAIDQVFNKSILNGSPEEITFLKKILQNTGKKGQQAWKDLQGETLEYLRQESSKGMGLDSSDRPLISTAKLHNAINQLDKNGRLDIVFGNKQANTLRELNDVVKYVSTSPPGTLINNSGTAGTLFAAIGEASITGAFTGLPIPVLTLLKTLGKEIKNKKLQIKINQALNNKENPSVSKTQK